MRKLTPEEQRAFPEHLRYPIGERVENMPGRPIQNNEGLAEEMAYAEKPYRDLAHQAMVTGADDAVEALLKLGTSHANEAEVDYYARHGVSKSLAKAMRAQLLWDVGAELEFSRSLTGEFETSLEHLNELRGAVQVFKEEARGTSVGNVTIIHFNASLNQMVEGFEHKLDIGESQKKYFRGKIQDTLGSLYQSAALRRRISRERGDVLEYSTATEAIQQVWVGTVAETARLVKVIESRVQQRKMRGTAAERVFGSYDLARFSVAEFEDIADLLDYEASNLDEVMNSMVRKPVEYEGLLEDMQQKRQERAENEQAAKAQQKVDRALARLAAANLRIPKDTAPEQIMEVVDEAFLDELRRKRQNAWADIERRNPTITELLDTIDVSGSFDVVLPGSTDATDFMVGLGMKFLEQSGSEYPHTVPKASYAQFDVDDVWRRRIVRPKGYYGGRVGRVSLAVQPLFTLDEKTSYTMPSYQGTRKPEVTKKPNEIARVGMMIETVKDRGREAVTDIGSYVEYVLRYSKTGNVDIAQDAARSFVIADVERLKREHAFDKQVGRIVQATNMLRTYQGGAASPR